MKTRRPSRPSALLVLAAAVGLVCLLGARDLLAGEGSPDRSPGGRSPGRPGGSLVVALRAEPKTFNPVLATDNPSLTVIRRLMADLVHIDRESQETVPALAESWTVSPDGRRYTVELRRGLRFSDGEAMDADDVVFTFGVYLDEKLASPHRDLLVVAGEPIAVTKLSSHRLELRLAEPYAVGERLFDSLPILPRHRLEKPWREGRFAAAWGTATPPPEIVGLGPFRLARYLPGDRLELEKNPHYFKVDAEGRRLPYLERVTFLFVASEDAQVIRFQSGETHLTDRLSAKNWALLERDQARRSYVLRDLGPGLNYNFLFFNLNDLEEGRPPEGRTPEGRTPEGRTPQVAARQKWFRSLAFRRAISAAIDREGIVRLVYRGRATPIATHVTPGNKLWLNSDLKPPRRSVAAARELLRGAGFRWDEEGTLYDGEGGAVEFSLITNSSNRERVEIATLLQDDLAQLGMKVQVVTLEFRALLDRLFSSHDYDACILGLGGGDVDPNSSIPFLTSEGGNHLWRLRRQGPPAPWQAEIDRLMGEQLVTLDPGGRKKLYDRVQVLVAENLPAIFLVSPNVLAGAHRDLGNFRPAILDHFTLWNLDELYWRAAGGQ